jgi:hypothetical protein
MIKTKLDYFFWMQHTFLMLKPLSECLGFIFLRLILNVYLESLGVSLLLHVVLPVNIHCRSPNVLLCQLGKVGGLNVLAEVVAVHADQVVGALLGNVAKVMPEKVVQNGLQIKY